MTDIAQEVTTVWDDFTSFLGHYAGEIGGVAHALTALLGATPIDPQTKATVSDAIDGLNNAVQNINDYVNNPPPVSSVTVNESDLVTAVQNFLESDKGKAALANAVALQSGNAHG